MFNKLFNKSMKIQLEKLSALKDKAADEISAEELSAVNDELKSQGFQLSVFAGDEPRVTQSEVDSAVASATTELTAQVNTLTTEATAKDATITANAAEIDRLKALAHGEKAPEKSGDKAHEEREEKPKSAFSGLQEKAKQYAKMNSDKKS